MSQPELSTSSRLLSLVGIIGAILVFAAILFVAYLPSRPAPIDQAVNDERQAKADQARAEGVAKLIGFEVIDAGAGTIRIPIADAMDSTVAAYKATK
jgi:hypothetical protein